jgi:uncharacterized protein YjaG (DUF416 family)
MSNLQNALHELREKRSQAQKEVEKLSEIISGIESLNGFATSPAISATTGQSKRIISAASRHKMALAQRARWASVRKQSQTSADKTPNPISIKRTMSAASRKKIAAALRARWAKIRAEKRAA